jgi:hypothetical protein
VSALGAPPTTDPPTTAGATTDSPATASDATTATPAQSDPPFVLGDLFLSIGNGQVEERKPADGSLVQTMSSGSGSAENDGSAFDASGNLYVTDGFSANQVSKFTNSGVFAGTFGSGYDGHPESILFDAAGNAYVGQPDGSKQVLKFTASGTPAGSFSPATEQRGTDWIDLGSDQCTVRYTSEGSLVKQFDVCTNSQLPDFASGLPGSFAYALRILPDGGALVADSQQVVRLDSSGAITQTYSTPGEQNIFALNLDLDGTSFWTADRGGDVFRFDIASGTQLAKFSLNKSVFGLSVFGERTAANTRPTTPPPPPPGPPGPATAVAVTPRFTG